MNKSSNNDKSHPPAMLDFGNFDLVFGDLSPFPFTRQWAQQVEKKRKEYDGVLFLDRVLAALNIAKASKVYPPKTEKDLRQLHHLVCDASNVAIHHKLSILYYILLDVDSRLEEQSPGSTPSTRADSFAADAAVPQKYSIFIKGLWYMDATNFDQALEHLTHPSLVPEFADEIVTALARIDNTASSSSSLQADESYSPVLAYYYAVQPVLRTSAATNILFDAISRSSVSEALRYSRARPQFMREQLFKRLVLSVIDDSSSSKNGGNDSSDDVVAERAFELTSASLDAQEEEWFRDALLGSEGRKVRVAKDTLLMRRIARGDAGPVSEKGAWSSVLEGFKQGSGGRGMQA
ncbi:nuclear pore complex assembly-domain-containing protein [Microdochium trichocladiopsis]|uniref:Nuclear pore complex assembly-domain-containing protein n=1 Tax=Microdochium trichocladiopsis TaxID=1682393 RepID=A0A9P9BLR5_9PEZI|nr:nuclear pore complex assembly-domain-containing protein [Microdochium trichocladiopsis]KAH7028868.1 nuclear pore complex assembly-domain-containing protein [Microdochium trichocladiopsis]